MLLLASLLASWLFKLLHSTATQLNSCVGLRVKLVQDPNLPILLARPRFEGLGFLRQSMIA